MASRVIHFPDPSPAWLRRARDTYREPTVALEKLIDRICRTDSGMAFHYRVRARTRRST